MTCSTRLEILDAAHAGELAQRLYDELGCGRLTLEFPAGEHPIYIGAFRFTWYVNGQVQDYWVSALEMRQVRCGLQGIADVVASTMKRRYLEHEEHEPDNVG